MVEALPGRPLRGLLDHALQAARQNVCRPLSCALVDGPAAFQRAIDERLEHGGGARDDAFTRLRRQAVVRGGDTVARLGGDEFVILLEDITDETDVVRLAERVVAALAEPVQVFHRQVRIGASIGVSTGPGPIAFTRMPYWPNSTAAMRLR